MNKFLSHFTKLWDAVKDNTIFLLEFLGIVLGIILVAYVAELLIRRKERKQTGTAPAEKILSTRKIAVTGVLAALAGILMLFEIPLPFVPSFYKLDFSEIPVLICGFAYGPVAGVLCEAVKIIIKLLLKGSSTAFVGELANFVVGCAFILPATIIYHIKKSKKTALIGCIVGTIVLVLEGTSFNAIYLLPKFSELYGMPMETIIAMGTAVNKNVNSVTSLVIMCVAPLNLLKGFSVSLVTMLIYHPLRPILKKG